MNNNTSTTKSIYDKVIKTIVAIFPYIMVAAFLVAVCIVVFGDKETDEEKMRQHEVVAIDTKGSCIWKKSSDIEVFVDGEVSNEFEYSFDGGNTWQLDNKFTTSENNKYYIHLKDKNGNTGNSIIYNVDIIDKKGPQIKVNFPTTIYLNDDINIVDYIIATDEGCGVKSAVSNPAKLDTSTPGNHEATVTVIDNLDNVNKFKITLNVTNKKNPNAKKESKKKTNSYSYYTIKEEKKPPVAEVVHYGYKSNDLKYDKTFLETYEEYQAFIKYYDLSNTYSFSKIDVDKSLFENNSYLVVMIPDSTSGDITGIANNTINGETITISAGYIIGCSSLSEKKYDMYIIPYNKSELISKRFDIDYKYSLLGVKECTNSNVNYGIVCN